MTNKLKEQELTILIGELQRQNPEMNITFKGLEVIRGFLSLALSSQREEIRGKLEECFTLIYKGDDWIEKADALSILQEMEGTK